MSYKGREELILPSNVEGKSDVQIRWHYYNAYFDWYWGIDDVQLTAVSVLDSLTGDFEPDCDVDYHDLSIFASAWLSGYGEINWHQACDISEPNDNVIDLLDFAVFSENWLIFMSQ